MSWGSKGFYICPECGESFHIGSDASATRRALFYHLQGDDGLSREDAYEAAGNAEHGGYEF